MKVTNFFRFGVMLLFVVMGAVACVDDVSELVEDEDVVEALENALKSKAGGFNAQIEDIATLIENYKDNCNQTFDSTLTKESGLGSLINYDYVFDLSWTVNCNNLNIPQSFDFTYSSTGTYTAPRMSSTDEGTYNFAVTGVQPTSDDLTFNGNYTRIGTQTTKIRTELQFSATLGVVLTDLIVAKGTREVQSGTGTFTFTGVTSLADTFSYTGVLTYNGDGTATATFNGKDYTINLD